jgi:hypothetical protein
MLIGVELLEGLILRKSALGTRPCQARPLGRQTIKPLGLILD